MNNSISNLEWCSYSYNNTYNGIAKKRGLKLRGREPWNKGKIGVMSDEAKNKISKARKRNNSFRGNQYVKISPRN